MWLCGELLRTGGWNTCTRDCDHKKVQTASVGNCSMDLTKATALQALLYPVKPLCVGCGPPSAAAYLLQLHVCARLNTCSIRCCSCWAIACMLHMCNMTNHRSHITSSWLTTSYAEPFLQLVLSSLIFNWKLCLPCTSMVCMNLQHSKQNLSRDFAATLSLSK